MVGDIFTLKDGRTEFKLIVGRLIILGFIVGLLSILLLFRVFDLAVLQHDYFVAQSKFNHIKIQPIGPVRGNIYSRDGIALAENEPVFNLVVTPEHLDDIEKTLEELGKVIELDEKDVTQFFQRMKTKRRFEKIVLQANLSHEQVARFAVNQDRFSGIEIEPTLNRYYPYADLLTHVLGYVARINDNDLKKIDKSNYSGTNHIGRLGIEKQYERILHGSVGYRHVETNVQNKNIRVLERQPPSPGADIYLTLDLGLQKITSDALQGERGAAVALDPTNGHILAFVSMPSYDPNLFTNGISHRDYQSLLSSDDLPLFNRALNGKYPPGSALKPFIGLIALANQFDFAKKDIWCPGWFILKGEHTSRRYRDWKPEGHGYIDLKQAIVQSCDVFFYMLGQTLGVEVLHSELAKFGFGIKTGIDLPDESIGVLPSDSWKRKFENNRWFEGDTLNMSIGQGYVMVTPIQLATATAMLANRGRYVAPSLILDPRVAQGNQQDKNHTISSKLGYEATPDIWKQIIQAMEDVVHTQQGTAWRSGVDASYRFAGKTGTAQKISIAQDAEYIESEIPKEFRDHALFIAFAPITAPRIAIAVIVENGGSGSATAAPIARKMLDYFMQVSIDHGQLSTQVTH